MSQNEVDMLMDSMVLGDGNPITVITNNRNMNNAIVMFYPFQMNQIREKMEGNYFVLPSSVQKIPVISDNGAMQHEKLKAMVTEIKAEMLGSSPFLPTICLCVRVGLKCHPAKVVYDPAHRWFES